MCDRQHIFAEMQRQLFLQACNFEVGMLATNDTFYVADSNCMQRRRYPRLRLWSRKMILVPLAAAQPVASVAGLRLGSEQSQELRYRQSESQR